MPQFPAGVPQPQQVYAAETEHLFRLSSKPCAVQHGYETIHHAPRMSYGKEKIIISKLAIRSARHRCALSRTERCSVVNQAVSRCAVTKPGTTSGRRICMSNAIRIQSRSTQGSSSYSFKQSVIPVDVQSRVAVQKVARRSHCTTPGAVYRLEKCQHHCCQADGLKSRGITPDRTLFSWTISRVMMPYSYQAMHYAGAELLPGRRSPFSQL